MKFLARTPALRADPGSRRARAVESVRLLHRGKKRMSENDVWRRKFLLGAHPPALSSRAGDAPNMAQLAQTTQAALSGQSKTVTVTVMGTSPAQNPRPPLVTFARERGTIAIGAPPCLPGNCLTLTRAPPRSLPRRRARARHQRLLPPEGYRRWRAHRERQVHGRRPRVGPPLLPRRQEEH